jgi:hypothetical protein
MLALGTYLLSHVMDEKDIKKLKLWEDMKAAWLVHREAVHAMRDKFEFKVPVELLLPSNPEDAEIVSEFRLALIDICAARNNNAQLTTEARANQRGFYEEIRKRMPKYLADRVEWKTNDWGSDDSRPIKVRDIHCHANRKQFFGSEGLPRMLLYDFGVDMQQLVVHRES